MKILILICSSNTEKSAALRQACRDTWLSKRYPNIEYMFFSGPDNKEKDVLSLDVNDTYEYLPSKVMACYRNVIDFRNFDYIFKCDDDTYISLDRLHSLLDGSDFVGNEFLKNQNFASGGAGYLISRPLLEKIVKEEIPEKGAEDVLISAAALKHSKKWKSTSRLHYGNDRYPNKDNDIITSHWLSVDKMLLIHDIYELNPDRIMEVVHYSWKDHLLLYKSGFFKRKNHYDFGKWEEKDDTLYLKWEAWAVEEVPKISDTIYQSDKMRIEVIG